MTENLKEELGFIADWLDKNGGPLLAPEIIREAAAELANLHDERRRAEDLLAFYGGPES